MGRRTDGHHGLINNGTDREIRGGYFVLRHALMGVARNASAFTTHNNASERLTVGPGAWLRASLCDIAQSCQRDYMLRGGTMEFESQGALHVLWVRIVVATGGGNLIFAPKSTDSGLLLVDATLSDEAVGTTLSITFKDVAHLGVTYDADADITLIGLLSGAPTELDCNAWAVVRFQGNACGLPDENSQSIPGQGNCAPLYIRHYMAAENNEICIIIKK